VPLIVRVKAPWPARAGVGAKVVIVGTGFVTSMDFELGPPPGPGLVTVTTAVVALATSEARIVILKVVELTNETVRLLPSHAAVLVDKKFVPLRVMV
jgi:hypothetical protein